MRSRPPDFRIENGSFNAVACSSVADSGLVCGATPFLHIVWEDPFDGETWFGFACTAHARLLDEFTPLQTHEPTGECGMPDTLWDFTANTCCSDDEIAEETSVDVEQPIEAAR